MKKFEKIAFILFFSFLLYVFLYKLWLLQIPEMFSMAYELGEIFYGLTLAYLTSFLFYLLVTFWPQYKQKQNVYKYVNYKAELILVNLKDILGCTSLTEDDIKYLDQNITMEEYSKQFDINVYPRNRDYDNISSEEIKTFFKRINYGGGGPVTKIMADGDPPTDVITWGGYLLENANITHRLVTETLNLTPFLEAEHVTILSKIQDAPYYYKVKNINPLVSKKSSLYFLADYFIEYYELIKEFSDALSLSLDDVKYKENSHIYLNNIGPKNNDNV